LHASSTVQCRKSKELLKAENFDKLIPSESHKTISLREEKNGYHACGLLERRA
jgi:hypothetical protein